ncbi:hypothetical protein ACTXG5_22875 [Mycobacterium sp. Dal123C01]|uniref:hypothetical protein n=1 Tax=Mycobacterium sp. Dal123C01 TaxID=3457577 RepID=UPI00403E8F7A
MVEMDVSMLLGRLDVEQTARFVTKRPPKPSAAVRYFNSDDLYLNGYLVTLTPSERIPTHVSVHFGPPFGIKDVEQARASWADPDRVTLDSLALPDDGNDQ